MASRHYRSGPPTGSGYWHLRAYLRGAIALATVVLVSFPAARSAATAYVAQLPQRCTYRCPSEEVFFRVASAFDLVPITPIHEQFVTFLATRLGYPPVLAFLVGGLVVALVLWWRDRAGSPRYR